MKTNTKLPVCTLFAMIGFICLSSSTLHAQIKCLPSDHPFARGYCSVERAKHGQWVRGKAELKPDGMLTIGLGLETDSTFFGIAGLTEAVLKDQDNTVVARYRMAKCAIPGKKPGKARIRDFSGTYKVPDDITAKVTKIETIPHIKDDNAPQPWGIGNYKVNVKIQLASR